MSGNRHLGKGAPSSEPGRARVTSIAWEAHAARRETAMPPPWMTASSEVEVRPVFVSEPESPQPGPDEQPVSEEDEAVRELTSADFRNIVTEARAEGLREGLREGKEQVVELMDRYASAIERLGSTIREASTPYGPGLISVAMVIAREIVGRELSIDADFLVENIAEAVAMLEEEESITVSLRPTELEFIARARPEIMSSGIEFIEDPNLPLGGCIVESPKQIIDASIDRRIEAIGIALREVFERPRTEDEPTPHPDGTTEPTGLEER